MSTTTPVISKHDLLRQISQSYRALRSAIEALPRERLTEDLSTGWSLNENIAHLAAWEETVPKRVAGVLESGEDPKLYDDVDAFNAHAAEEAQGKTTEELLTRWTAAHDRIVEAIHKLTAELIHGNDDWVIAVVAGNTYGHYAEHFDEVIAGVPKRPAQLLEKMREGWRPFRRALNRLGLSALSGTTSSGWTYKGMLGHVAYWLEQVPPELPNRLQGRRTPGPDVDGENSREAQRGLTRSARDVIQRLDAAYEGVVDAVSALPSDRDVPFLALQLVVGETYGHFPQHLGEIEAVLPQTSDQFVERIEQIWKPFRAAIRERGRAGLMEKTSSGWTYKDVVAHVVGWMEQTVREMRTKEFSTGWTKETILAFNEVSVRTHDLVGPEAMLDELDSSYRRLVETIRGLGDGEVDERISSTMPYYTYLHWEEHFAELGIPL